MNISKQEHYNDVVMGAIASQITSLTIVYSTVYSDADQRKHQSSASLAFVRGIHRDRWIPRTNGQLRGKSFHLMTSSWKYIVRCVSTSRHPWVLPTKWRVFILIFSSNIFQMITIKLSNVINLKYIFLKISRNRCRAHNQINKYRDT